MPSTVMSVPLYRATTDIESKLDSILFEERTSSNDPNSLRNVSRVARRLGDVEAEWWPKPSVTRTASRMRLSRGVFQWDLSFAAKARAPS